MVKSSSSSKNEIFDDSFCSTSCKKNTESLNTKITELSKKLSDSKTMLYHYKLGLSQVEARLVEFKNQEIKLYEKIRGLEFNVKCKNNIIERLTNELEELKKERRTSSSIESNSSDLQSNNSSVFWLGESSGSIMSKPMIKFVKAGDSLKIIKTTKGETARKPPRVKGLERELKARTPPIKIHKVDVRGRSRSVMAWVPKKVLSRTSWHYISSLIFTSPFAKGVQDPFRLGSTSGIRASEKALNKKNHFHKSCLFDKKIWPIQLQVPQVLQAQILKYLIYVEERLVVYKKNEDVLINQINVLNLDVKLRDKVLAEYTKKLEKAEKERDELKLILEKLQNSSKSLNALLESQVSDKDKTRLGYKAASPAVEGFVNSSKILEIRDNQSDKGYHEVPHLL
uniref:Uncharacterized protein n=1 Tax=Tanacetum cinerariifolium TaxID=118510 RepID=A0A699HTD1_TANCI|nr:hypothetical protein [Tanacetum cinerariifolium]